MKGGCPPNRGDLTLPISIIALVVSLRIARENIKARLEQLQFSWIPLVAVEGDNLGGAGGTRKLDRTVHLEGRGFAHNLILNLWDSESTSGNNWRFGNSRSTARLV